MSKWTEIRCPKCHNINSIVKVCPKCNFQILDTLNNYIKWFKIFDKIKKISFCLSLPLIPIFFIVALGSFIDKIPGSTFQIVACISLITWFTNLVGYGMSMDLGPRIKEYNPDQSVSLVQVIAALFAIGLGVEHICESFDTIGSGIDVVTDEVVNIDHVETATSSVFLLDPGHIADLDSLSDPSLHIDSTGSLSLPQNIDLDDSIIGLKHHTSVSEHYIIADHLNIAESRVDVNGNITTLTNNMGVPTAHIENNINSSLITDNINRPVGYIDHSLVGDTLIKNTLGITEYHIDDTGSIFNAHGDIIGHFEHSGELLVIKDMVSNTVHSVSKG